MAESKNLHITGGEGAAGEIKGKMQEKDQPHGLTSSSYECEAMPSI